MTLTINIAQMQREIQAHLDADKLTRGVYWDGERGCFIGCLAHSRDPKILWERFRLPEPLVRICESIHESVGKDTGRAFFRDFGQAVGCDGKDLSLVHWAFLAAELRALPETTPEVQAVVDPVIAGMDLLASGGVWSKEEAADAADATSAAVYAATNAADYAAARAACAADYAADATYTAGCATYAAYATDAAVYAVNYAADYAAARAAARQRQITTLLRLIKEAPVKENVQ